MTLKLFYNEEWVRKMGVDEERLRVVHYDQGWIEKPDTQLVNTDLNWVSVEISETGIYALRVADP